MRTGFKLEDVREREREKKVGGGRGATGNLILLIVFTK